MASSDDNMDYKVSKVLEVHPNKDKQEVVIVLRYYGLDVDTAVNAYTEGNIPEELRTSSSNSINNKNKRKKRKNKKASLGAAAQLNETNSTPKITPTVVKNNNSAADADDDDDEYEMSATSQLPQETNRNISEVSERVGDSTATDKNNSTSQNGDVSKSPTNHPSTKPKASNASRDGRGESVTSQSPENAPDTNASPKKSPHDFTKPYPKNRHRSSGSFSQSRTTSLSEETSSQASFASSAPIPQGKISLDKSMKDLSRQTVALSRVSNILEEELETSFKRIKTAIAEAQKLLEERNLGLEHEMEKVKKDARALLTQRKEIAAELKQRADRAATLTEVELKELKDDIKHFVVERKFDDELGKTTRFMWDKDRITQEIRNFGEVYHVKNCYSQRRQSVSSVASSTCLTPSILESPTEQKLRNLTTDLKDGNVDESNSHDGPHQSDIVRPHNPTTTTQFQGRSRVFFSQTRPHYGGGSNSDYGGGTGGGGSSSNFNNPSTQTGSGGGGASGLGGGSNQSRPNYRHYQQPRGGRGGHFNEGGQGGRGRGGGGRGGYYNKPHYNNNNNGNNQRYNNAPQGQQQHTTDAEESGAGNNNGNNNRNRPPQSRRGGGRNPRFQNHNQGRSYHHHNNSSNVSNQSGNDGNVVATASKDVRVNGDKNVTGGNNAAAEGNKPTMVNGYVGNHT